MSKITACERLSNKAIYEHCNASIAEIYHENSKLNAYRLKYLQFELAQSVADPDFKPVSLENGKTYPTLSRKKLLPIERIDLALGEALLMRRSVREFQESPIPYQTLSNLLTHSAGINSIFRIDGNGSKTGFRAYPSAGALYPLEIYILINRVDDVAAGLYHYNVRSSCLECLYEGETAALVDKYKVRDQAIKETNTTLFVTAVFKRTTYKYGDRGYRFIMMEVGHLFQNISLVAVALGLGTCEIGGCEDDELNSMLQIDGVNEAIVGEIAIGVASPGGNNSMPDIHSNDGRGF